MGEDGHTASLFPGHKNDQDETVHEVYNSPKPPSDRISLSAKTLSKTLQCFFIVTGDSKRDPVKQWKQGADLPVATIAPATGVDIYIDFIRAFLTFVVPIALIFTVPAKALFGLLSLKVIIFSLIASVFIYSLSLLFWRHALTKYSSASS